MALLLVVTTIAILTSVVVEFAYDTHVDLRLAANARDELRAHYLARSATGFSRLILHFQRQLDQVGSNMPAGMGMGAIDLWRVLPIECEAITSFVRAVEGGGSEDDVPLAPLSPAPGELVPAAGLRPFGDFEGCFVSEIEDEESKINLNKLNNPGVSGMFAGRQLYELIADPRWDFLFQEENLHRERITREELLIRLKDWIDPDKVESGIDFTSPTHFFVPGVADEERAYSSYPQRYKPKNALFVSMDEVHLVAGMSDRLMAAFGDKLTVYPDINAKFNLNTHDPEQLLMVFQMLARNKPEPALQNPLVVEMILEQLDLARASLPFARFTVQHFIQALEAVGIEVDPTCKHNVSQCEFGDKSETFTIRATGVAGGVSKTLTTVVRYDDKLGKVLYYRED